MSLKGKGKVHLVNDKAYIYIPVKVTTDSQFPFKDKQYILVKIEGKKMVITGEQNEN